MQIYKTLMLDLVNPNGYNLIYAMQADRRSRFVSVGFTYDGSTYTIPNGATVIVEGKTANGKNIYHNCIVKDNMAIFELSEKILQSHGRSCCVLGIYIPETDQLLHSVDFYISITSNPLDPSSVTNSSEYSALVNTVMESKRLIEKTRENILIFKGIQEKWATIKLDALETIAATNVAKDNAIQATEDLRELETYVSETEAIRQDNEYNREVQEGIRQDNEVDRQNNEDDRQQNESDRQHNEDIRQNNEDDRILHEDIREDNEEARKLNEIVREHQEDKRIENEDARIANENTRKGNESNRQAAEESRDLQEDIREESEAIRINNENDRISEDAIRDNYEQIRNSNELNRQNSELDRRNTEDTRNRQESIREENEELRLMAESERDVQEQLRQDNENIREANEAIRKEQEDTRQTDTADAIANAEFAIQDAIDATESANESTDKADAATERANTAAEGCEEIIAGTGFISVTEKGATNGLATLDSNKKLTTSQLPLGELSTTAFAGDRGKALEDKIEELQTDLFNKMQGFVGNTVVFSGDRKVITETSDLGVKVTTFSDDRKTITEVLTKLDGSDITKTTIFHDDGTITEVIT